MLVKGSNDTTTKTSMAAAHLQEFGGLREVGDIYVIYGQAFCRPFFAGKKELAAALPSTRLAAAATHNARRRLQGQHITNSTVLQALWQQR